MIAWCSGSLNSRGQAFDAFAILVEAGGQPDPVGKLDSHHLHRIAMIGPAVRRERRTGEPLERGQRQIVGGFGIERKQQRAGELIKHGAQFTRGRRDLPPRHGRAERDRFR